MAQVQINTQNIMQNSDFRRIKTLFSGLVAGLVSRTAVAPFERVVIIKQTSMSEYNSKEGIFTILRNMHQNEGVKGFFRGNAANCFRIAPTTAIEFFLYDLFKIEMARLPFLSEKLRYAVSGGMAGVVAYSVAYPIDVVKTFQSLGLYRNESVLQTLRILVKEKGVLQLYRGLLATCCVNFD